MTSTHSFPRNSARSARSPSSSRANVAPAAGRWILRNESSSQALRVTFTTSASAASRRTSGRNISVPLLNSAVLKFPAAFTCRSTSPNRECIVGSPEPESVT